MNRIRQSAMVLAIFSFSAGSAFPQVDLTGNWTPKTHSDWQEELPGPDLVDYLGLPINDAARTVGLSYSASSLSLPEHQCMYYSPNYIASGPQALKIWATQDPDSGRIVAWNIGAVVDRGGLTIWMDGRPHPSENAEHPLGGFTTGTREGSTLVTYTTHMREGYIRRNGLPMSDRATFSMRITRHEDTLTVVARTEDPVYLTEPLVQSRVFVLNTAQTGSEVGTPCSPVVELANLDGSGKVPHYLPGKNPATGDIESLYHIPPEASLGGAETMYPEFREKVRPKFTPAPICSRYCCGWAGNGAAAVSLGCIATAP